VLAVSRELSPGSTPVHQDKGVKMLPPFLVLTLVVAGARGPHSELGPLPSWELVGYARSFSSENLHEFLDGGAAKYLVYNLQSLQVQEYTRSGDGFQAVAEVYAFDKAENAFGAYSCDRGGTHPEGPWAEASYESGLLQFWQGRYYVRVYALDPSRDAPGAVLELAVKLCERLRQSDGSKAGAKPSGGTRPPQAELPAIVRAMPSEGLIKDSLCFFHEQVSLNNVYYLAERNVLRLGPDTDAVAAEYRTSSGGTATALAVHYPEAQAARAAFEEVVSALLPASQAVTQGEVTSAVSKSPEGGALYAAVAGRRLVLVPDAPSRDEAELLGRTVITALAELDRASERAAGED
jgi:hypothetical protein